MSRLVRHTLSKRYTTLFRIEVEKFGSHVPVLGRTPPKDDRNTDHVSNNINLRSMVHKEHYIKA